MGNKGGMKHLRKIYFLAAFAFFALMIGIGSIPNQANELSSIIPDKVLHMAAYGILAGLLYMGQSPNNRYRGRIAVLAIGLMGALDEGVQSMFTYRTPSWADWSCDIAAALIAVGLLRLRESRRSYQPG
jgi:VanZ family protein